MEVRLAGPPASRAIVCFGSHTGVSPVAQRTTSFPHEGVFKHISAASQ